jgi:hypothetical protein
MSILPIKIVETGISDKLVFQGKSEKDQVRFGLRKLGFHLFVKKSGLLRGSDWLILMEASDLFVSPLHDFSGVLDFYGA